MNFEQNNTMTSAYVHYDTQYNYTNNNQYNLPANSSYPSGNDTSSGAFTSLESQQSVAPISYQHFEQQHTPFKTSFIKIGSSLIFKCLKWVSNLVVVQCWRVVPLLRLTGVWCWRKNIFRGQKYVIWMKLEWMNSEHVWS